MDRRTLSRELSLVSLGLINDDNKNDQSDIGTIDFEKVLESAVELLINHCRQELDECEIQLESVLQNLLECELREGNNAFLETTREDLKNTLINIENIMNSLSDSLDLPKLIAVSNQEELRNNIKDRLYKITFNLSKIDSDIDEVMEGWRFKRLPRIDRDILRLAYVDLHFFKVPVSVVCNEAVNLANKYSDLQGRKMINGVLRRMQKVTI